MSRKQNLFMLDNITLDPLHHAKYALILFHGLGSDGKDFIPLARKLRQLTKLPIRFIFPHAPAQPVTLANGHVMPAWYDILAMTVDATEDREGLNEISLKVDQLIQEQVQLGIPPEHIFLGGFSQGGAVALYTGLRYPQKLGGIIGLSTYLPFRHHLEEEKHPVNHHTPIFLVHGEDDLMLPLEWANISRHFLEKTHHDITWHSYPMGHEVSEQEVMDLANWILKLVV